MVLLGKIALGITGTMLAGVGAICSQGMIEVNVVERQPEVHHVYVIAPAMLVPIVTHFIPRHDLGDASQQLRPYMTTIRAALDQLQETEDFVMVDVKDRQEHVEVPNIGGSLEIDVKAENETVHVETPVRMISSRLEQLTAKESATAG